MSKYLNAATIAAISVTLGSAFFPADPGFAFGNSQNMALNSYTELANPPTTASAQHTVLPTQEREIVTKVAGNGDIVFTPGNGGGPVMNPTELPINGIQNPETLSAASLADMVRKQDTDRSLSSEEQCLAGAVYFESKSESLAGQLAVARVVMARSKSGRFPSSLCGVVYQKSQFSFVRGNGMPRINTSSAHWRNAVAISKIALNNAWKSPVEGALFFHARRVSPGWRLTRLGTVDNHVFYR